VKIVDADYVMMPRLRPSTAACVGSLAPNFDRMFRTWPFTVSSVTANFPAMF
jgi:hypothetical protein